MTHTLIIPSRLPGLNEIIAAAKKRRGNWNRYNDTKQQGTSGVASIIRLAKLPKIGPARYAFEWQCKDKRRNPDNITAGQKVVFDALVAAGIIPNDGWDEVRSITHTFTKGKENQVIVTITETE